MSESLVAADDAAARIEKAIGLMRRRHRASPAYRGQAKRPAYEDTLARILNWLLRRLWRRAAYNLFPLDRHKLAPYIGVPEHIIRRAIEVFIRLGLVERVTPLERRRDALGPNPFARGDWYKAHNYAFTDDMKAILAPESGATDSTPPFGEPVTDQDKTSTVHDEAQGVSLGSLNLENKVLVSCVVGRKLAEYTANLDPHMSEDERRDWINTARIIFQGETASLLPQVKAKPRATREREASRPHIERPASELGQKKRLLLRNLDVIEGRLDPLTVWPKHDGMTHDESREQHRLEALEFYRFWSKRVEV